MRSQNSIPNENWNEEDAGFPNTSSKKVTYNIPKAEDEVPLINPTINKPASPGNNAGIGVMLFTTFLASVCFSIVLPSIYRFLSSMHENASVVGWAVAVNSAGSFLASPVFGAWADRRSTREVLAFTLIIMIVGNVMYSLSVNIWLLLGGRFLVGVAAANYAVAQTYLSYATTVDNRTLIMALNSAANVLGFIIGPSFALGLSYINFSVYGIKVDDLTSPGYLSAIMSLFGLLSLVTLKEISPSQKRLKGNQKAITGSSKYGGSGFYSGGGSVKDVSQIIKMSTKKNLPLGGILVCLWAYFCYTTSFTIFETIGAAYTQDAFGWGVSQNSIMYAGLGGACIASLVILQFFSRCLNDRILVCGATLLSIAGFAIITNLDNTVVTNFPRFVIGVGLCSAGYATSVAVLISLYSKILESMDQGMLMGWLSSAGSIARIVGPVFASYAYEYGHGPRLVFLITNALICSSFLILAFSYKRLAPVGVKGPEEGVN